ncbi:short-chain dehydrogenase [Methylobacterium sp. Leaf104]|uniref:SDR family NAD(P)-dependent oxidoreductase n=1 Tax=Methylobacterium TaxID=407 RepID=UPI0006FD07C0|nr:MULTISPECIES: SDR family NAD(P)-dependent oxidoreductase [Methylobacterium]KQP41010.1 short-chain dehydrogenase [Methylobacterium sp. Leaf104]MCI9882604.1 SDR family NAD(P)-dependent oxidoreductase [Methylobacterium goesingense]
MPERIALVTGATSGIGAETALGLARAGFRVGLVGRDADRTGRTAARIREAVPGAVIDGFVADLASQAGIRRLAGEVRARYPRLDVLVNNAGAIFDRHAATVDGIERTWALDHLAYLHLSLELLDLLKASAPARIVSVASMAHRRGRIAFDDIGHARRYSAIASYSQAKLGNVLFSAALARRLAGTGVTSNALHPGVIASGFASGTGGWFGLGWRLVRPFLSKPEDGAATSLYLATSREVDGVSGLYFDRCRAVAPSALGRDTALQERVWAYSLGQLGMPDIQPAKV